jgi:hypothetical protein
MIRTQKKGKQLNMLEKFCIKINENKLHVTQITQYLELQKMNTS